MGAGTSITLSNCGTNCPKCGSTANMLDGTFRASAQGIVELVRGTPLSEAIWKQFVELATRHSEDKISKEEFETEAKKLNPALEPVAKEIGAKPKSTAILAAVIAAGLLLKQCNFNINVDAKIDVNDLFRSRTQIEQTIEPSANRQTKPSSKPHQPNGSARNSSESNSATDGAQGQKENIPAPKMHDPSSPEGVAARKRWKLAKKNSSLS